MKKIYMRPEATTIDIEVRDLLMSSIVVEIDSENVVEETYPEVFK